MNRQMVTGQWKSMRGDIKRRWPKLTDQDLDQVEGKYDEFLARLQSVYGYDRERVETEVADFIAGYNPEDIRPIE